jgi:hypothetical protein
MAITVVNTARLLKGCATSTTFGSDDPYCDRDNFDPMLFRSLTVSNNMTKAVYQLATLTTILSSSSTILAVTGTTLSSTPDSTSH